MEHKIITYISIFGFILVVISQIITVMDQIEAQANRGDPLVEAINNHISTHEGALGSISRAAGGMFSNNSMNSRNDGTSPGVMPEGYRPYVPKRPVAQPMPVQEDRPLPSLDDGTIDSNGYSPSPSGTSSYYPQPSTPR